MSKKKTKVELKLTRGDFLTIFGATLGSVALAEFVTLGPFSPFTTLKQRQLSGQEGEGHTGPDSAYHWGMVINLDKCIGCAYCQRACSAVNDVAPDKPWNLFAEEKTPTGHPFFLTRPCLHCQIAPCVEVCPVKATYHRNDGLVVMDYGRCIGCRYCEVACPYDARKFNWQARDDVNEYIPTWGIAEVDRRPRGVVEKCTFCIHRIDHGIQNGFIHGIDREATPACVNICPVEARIFGNLNDPESPINKVINDNPVFRLRDELGTEASVYYIPPKEGL